MRLDLSRFSRRRLALVAVGTLAVAGAAVVPVLPAFAATSCSVTVNAQPWTEGPGVGGYTAYLRVNNTGDPWTSWTLQFNLPSGQSFTQGWSANWTPSGTAITATSMSWNGNVGTGGGVDIGFNGRWTGSFSPPSSFTVNGVACGGTPTPTTTTTQAPQPPGTPGTLTASGTTANSTNLSWGASSGTVTNYQIERCQGSTCTNFAQVGTSTTTTFSNTGLTANTTYRFRVRATNSAGNSGYSNIVNVTTSGTVTQPPGTPGTLSASGTTANSTNLSWGASSGSVANYQIERCQGSTCTNFAQVGTSTTTTFTSTGLTANTTYRFRVRATNSAGNSGYSNIVNVTTTNTSTTTSQPPGKADNPYAGATGYVNPEWRAKAESVSGGNRVSNTSTAVWLDRIAAIEGTPDSSSNGPMGLEDHLDAAVQQDAANGSAPVVIQVVIYNLPGRDCSALASNGELGPNDLPRYKAEYIDPIRAIMALPKFSALRIVTIIEIDSLPNLVTNLNVAACATMNSNGGYVNGVGYALARLGSLPNVHNYIDAAHHAWIGWDSNFGPTAQKLREAAGAEGSTPAMVHGFIVNTANYSALEEPYIDINGTINGQQIRSARWFDWNPYEGEVTFAQAFRTRLVGEGFSSNIGMLIDTSRNGWGGSARPGGPSTSTDLNTFVDQSRIDRRIHAGNWCNQSGAGLGERPRANPATGIDAYVWVKPPGESDGSSTEIPNDEGKGFDRMCDPTYTGNERNGNSMTGALPNAPISGAWFPAQFAQLMQNAFPAL